MKKSRLIHAIKTIAEDLIEALRVFASPRLAGLLYLRYRVIWRGVFYVDTDTLSIRYINNYMLLKTGYERRQIRKTHVMNYIHADDHDRMRALFTSQQEGEVYSSEPVRWKHAEGHYVYLQWTSVCVGDWYVAEASAVIS